MVGFVRCYFAGGFLWEVRLLVFVGVKVLDLHRYLVCRLGSKYLVVWFCGFQGLEGYVDVNRHVVMVGLYASWLAVVCFRIRFLDVAL